MKACIWKYLYNINILVSFWVEANLCRFFIIVKYVLPLEIQSSRGEFPLTSFTLPHFCVFPKLGLDFQRHMPWSFFVFRELRWEVIVRFVDIGGLVDHHCLNFLFITFYHFNLIRSQDFFFFSFFLSDK